MEEFHLLKKYVAGTCSPEELPQVLRYIATPEGEAALRQLMEEEEKRLEKLPAPDAATSDRIFHRLQPHLIHRRYYRWAAAAAVFVLVGTTLLFRWLAAPVTVYTTGFGETRTIVLPDSSTVILNGNSTLTLSDEWTDSREVWLEGEGFFNVKKLQRTSGDTRSTSKPYIKFVVHAEPLNVEVLGTEFNVQQRPRQTAVVLQSGRIRLNQEQSLDTLTMQPGERVVVTEGKPQLKAHAVNPTVYTAWTRQQLVFEGTPLREIARTIEETYGYEVILRGDSLADKRFQGSIPSDDIEVLLEGLSEAFGIRVERNRQQLIIRE